MKGESLEKQPDEKRWWRRRGLSGRIEEMRPSPTYLLNVTAYSALCLRAVFSPNAFPIVTLHVTVCQGAEGSPFRRPFSLSTFTTDARSS